MLKVKKLQFISFLRIETQVFIRNLVDHMPNLDKKYEKPCFKVKISQKLSFLGSKTSFS